MIPIYSSGGTKVTELAQPPAKSLTHYVYCHLHLPVFNLWHDLLSLFRTRSFSRLLSRCCRTARQRSTSSACRSERPCRQRSSLRTTKVPIVLLSHLSVPPLLHLSVFQLINTAYFMMRADQFLVQNFTAYSLPVKNTHSYAHTQAQCPLQPPHSLRLESYWCSCIPLMLPNN